jgi:hypothetical protein
MHRVDEIDEKRQEEDQEENKQPQQYLERR